jgi:tetratricopeptide (TPR) repeat protein
MSSTSVRRYKGTTPDPQAVAKELDVDVVVVGRVLQASDDLSINVELINTKDNSQLWGGQYERRLADILGVKGEISQEISTILHLELSGEQQEQIAKQGTSNPEAYQDYLQGRYHWNKRTPEGFERALKYFQLAIDKDPNYAQAYSGLSDAYFLQAVYSQRSNKEFYALELEASQRALELDDQLAEAHSSMGGIRAMHDWDWDAGEEHLKRAIQLDPNYFRAYQMYAIVLELQGRSAEWQEVYNKALTLDPLSNQLAQQHSRFLLSQGDYEGAVQAAERAYELDPDSGGMTGILVSAYWHAGMRDKAIALSERDGSTRATFLRQVAEGNFGGARETLEALEGIPDWAKGANYALIGETDLAIEWLTKAVDDRLNSVVFYNSNISYDSIRDDPRFQDLLRRMNLQP